MASERWRSIRGYVVLLAITLTVAIGGLVVGSQKEPVLGVAGLYQVDASPCLGDRMELLQSGSFVDVGPPTDAEGIDTESQLEGTVRLSSTSLTGAITCRDGTELFMDGQVDAENGEITGSVGGTAFQATQDAFGAPESHPEDRGPEETLGRLMLAIAAVIIAARFTGALVLGSVSLE